MRCLDISCKYMRAVLLRAGMALSTNGTCCTPSSIDGPAKSSEIGQLNGSVHTLRNSDDLESPDCNFVANSKNESKCFALTNRPENECASCDLENSENVFKLKCKVCGRSVSYFDLVGHIKDAFVLKSSAASTDQRKALMRILAKVSSQNSVEFLLFSLGLDKRELGEFLKSYSSNSPLIAARDRIPLLEETVSNVVENWHCSAIADASKAVALGRNSKRSFLCKIANCKKKPAEMVSILQALHSAERPVSQMVKMFLHARIASILDLISNDDTKSIVKILHQLADNSSDIADISRMHLDKLREKAPEGGKQLELVELQLMNAIFSLEHYENICEQYVRCEHKRLDLSLKCFSERISRMLRNEKTKEVETKVTRFCEVVSGTFRVYVDCPKSLPCEARRDDVRNANEEMQVSGESNKPSLLAVANIVEIAKQNGHLQGIAPELKTRLARILAEYDVLDAISELSSDDFINKEDEDAILIGKDDAGLINKEDIFKCIFTFARNKSGNLPTFIFINALKKPNSLISKAVIAYEMFNQGYARYELHHHFANKLRRKNNIFYCEYMRGCALYILKMLVRKGKRLCEIQEYLDIYVECFVDFQMILQRFAKKTKYPITECSLYGLSSYVCEVVGQRGLSIDHICRFPAIPDDNQYCSVVTGIIAAIDQSTGAWIEEYLWNSLRSVMAREIEKEKLSNGISMMLSMSIRLFKVAGRVIKCLLSRKIPLMGIYDTYLAKKEYFVSLLVFQYFKQLCCTRFANMALCTAGKTANEGESAGEEICNSVLRKIQVFEAENTRVLRRLDKRWKFQKYILDTVNLFLFAGPNLGIDANDFDTPKKLACGVRNVLLAYMVWKHQDERYKPLEVEYIASFEELFSVNEINDGKLLEFNYRMYLSYEIEAWP